MINCIIIDDEAQNIAVLKKMLKQYCPEVAVVGETTNAPDAPELIAETNPQLVFLDIEMPRMNAFDLLNQLMPVSFELIFVTAFADHAARAFKYSAMDYLLKPVDIDELRQAVQKAVLRIRENDMNKRLKHFLHANAPGTVFSKIALPTGNGLVFYPVEDIICCTAKGTFTQFEFVKDRQLLVAGNLKTFEETLPPAVFCRIHHSHLVNLNHIRKYYKGKGGYVEMTNGRTIEVSLRKRDEFLMRLGY